MSKNINNKKNTEIIINIDTVNLVIKCLEEVTLAINKAYVELYAIKEQLEEKQDIKKLKNIYKS